ncbi:type III PLP-dependent enzyme [Pelagibius sp. CAU 1746]|uniref:type III PLP-dependent enzyme n=1 Tax=Pelagibius sp. CAU 1746 TaxID=3140370 RepID=UPI00325B0041
MAIDKGQFTDVAAVAKALQPSYPVYCVRPEVLAGSARRFISQFPGTVLYAVKCNPHPLVLDALYQGGLRHFDTASLAEIAQISDAFSDAHTYFMHPVKARAVIKSAFKVYGVRHFVVDHIDELNKVVEEVGAQGNTIIVRVNTPPADDALYHLAAKFGAGPEEAAELMKAAAGRGAAVGLAFHVGSQCRSPEAYGTALEILGEVIGKAEVEPVCIDVGGGFPAAYGDRPVPALDTYMAAIRDGLKRLRLSPTVDIFSEPGRALVAHGCSLLTQVQLRKGNRLYINDGIYGSLSEMSQVAIRLPARLIRLSGPASDKPGEFVLNGPTCDSLDVLPGTFTLPEDVREGDWIEIDQVGAYSNALATRFNGFHPETFVQVFDAPPALAVA